MVAAHLPLAGLAARARASVPCAHLAAAPRAPSSWHRWFPRWLLIFFLLLSTATHPAGPARSGGAVLLRAPRHACLASCWLPAARSSLMGRAHIPERGPGACATHVRRLDSTFHLHVAHTATRPHQAANVDVNVHVVMPHAAEACAQMPMTHSTCWLVVSSLFTLSLGGPSRTTVVTRPRGRQKQSDMQPTTAASVCVWIRNSLTCQVWQCHTVA